MRLSMRKFSGRLYPDCRASAKPEALLREVGGGAGERGWPPGWNPDPTYGCTQECGTLSICPAHTILSSPDIRTGRVVLSMAAAVKGQLRLLASSSILRSKRPSESYPHEFQEIANSGEGHISGWFVANQLSCVVLICRAQCNWQASAVVDPRGASQTQQVAPCTRFQHVYQPQLGAAAAFAAFRNRDFRIALPLRRHLLPVSRPAAHCRLSPRRVIEIQSVSPGRRQLDCL